MTASSGRLVGQKHVMPLRVYYEDTDAQGVVYHANYLRYAERARAEIIRLLGISQRQLKEERGLIFTIKRATIDYRAPARLDDLLEVHTSFVALRAASLVADQRIMLEGHLIADIQVHVVMLLLATGRPARVPPEVMHPLQRLCQSGTGE
ncbi:MAG TPA: tol-pal system-associated acyl-CoA thioesterase [Kiloniellales bacterium]|nr:tol-pal system-associated acyl-CoA thioesterase [Kiloniellales bacterium]